MRLVVLFSPLLTLLPVVKVSCQPANYLPRPGYLRVVVFYLFTLEVRSIGWAKADFRCQVRITTSRVRVKRIGSVIKCLIAQGSDSFPLLVISHIPTLSAAAPCQEADFFRLLSDPTSELNASNEAGWCGRNGAYIYILYYAHAWGIKISYYSWLMWGWEIAMACQLRSNCFLCTCFCDGRVTWRVSEWWIR